jgi:2-hydroxychromene-2-carboxylate isomerase
VKRTAGAAGNGEAVHIAFYFDVMCPWAYQTSKWIRTVRTEVPLDIEWRFASLEEFNHDEGKKHPWEREWSYGWGMLRVAAMLRRQSMEACDRFYEAAGRALHEDGRKPHRPEVAEEICGALGYDPSVVREAIADSTTSDEVKAEHDQLVAVGGFGVPTLVFPDGQHVFGPVVVPAPTGADARALWDLTVAYTRVPNLFELKTPKSPAAMQHIARNFEPYLRARDWETREKPAP